MKKSSIIAIVFIAVAIGVLITTIGDSSTYSDFSEAFENPSSEFHVVGELVREKPTEYNPQDNADLFKFFMVDENGTESQVHLHRSKPQDFERSEKIVIIGKAMENSQVFHANDILMKCPSKYNDGSAEFQRPAETASL